MEIETSLPLLEEILGSWRSRIGADYDAYRNHVYRMLNFCFFLRPPSEEERRKLIIAAAFHDIGIWSDHTVDYLPPSIAQARLYLDAAGLGGWAEEIAVMIDMHHKLRAYRDGASPLVEIFRQGDLVDFSLGFFACGVPKSFIQAVKQALPNAGFHKRLVELSWQQFKAHPLDPAPMMRF